MLVTEEVKKYKDCKNQSADYKVMMLKPNNITGIHQHVAEKEKNVFRSQIALNQINLDELKSICYRFPTMPFLSESFKQLENTKPYQGLKIVHNVHLTLSTIWKLLPLFVSGADVTVTLTSNLQFSQDAIDMLKKAKVKFLAPDELVDDFDVSLDCGAGLVHLIRPRLGAAELTQSGKTDYQSKEIRYPVISVDEGYLKRLETFLGTGDGFQRAFPMLVSENYSDEKFVLFGYGKVGEGIVRALRSMTKGPVIIIEIDEKRVQFAKKRGLEAVSIYDTDLVKRYLDGAFCAITATGDKHAMSKFFTQNDFKCKYLVNMGTDDEFGPNFSENRVLCKKNPINFILEEPTLVKFLDPVFYAHNKVIDFLLTDKFDPGFHQLPKSFDMSVVNRWAKYYGVDVSEIYHL